MKWLFEDWQDAMVLLAIFVLFFSFLIALHLIFPPPLHMWISGVDVLKRYPY